MFVNIAPAIANRPGGYVRIVRLGFRPSDAAEVAMIELVDFNSVALNAAAAESDKKRTRRGRKKKSDETSSEEINDTVKPEDTELNVQNDSVESENKDKTEE
jgi:large subunit ribosomal protein L17